MLSESNYMSRCSTAPQKSREVTTYVVDGRATAERVHQTRQVEDQPKPYHSIRKVVIHESLVDRADAILRVRRSDASFAMEARRVVHKP